MTAVANERLTGSAEVAAELFARLVGRYPGSDLLLFEVDKAFLDNPALGEWSEPVRFRFVRDDGARVTMELRRAVP